MDEFELQNDTRVLKKMDYLKDSGIVQGLPFFPVEFLKHLKHHRL